METPVSPVGDLDIPDLCNCMKLRRAARHLSRFYDAQVAASGLRGTQFAVLANLLRYGPKPMLELAAHMTVDRATMGHNLRPLERDGLISIDVGPTDRRVKMVAITEAGVERLAAGREGWERAQAEFESKFGSQAAADLRAMMERVIACDLGNPDDS